MGTQNKNRRSKNGVNQGYLVGLVIGKILAAAPAAISFNLAYDNRAANLATENINRSIKSVAKLGLSIAQMLLNQSLETTPWLGPGTHLLNSIL